MLIGHVSCMEKLAAMLGLKPVHTISLPLSSMDGTKETKLVVVRPSSETVSEKGWITSCPLCHLIRDDGFEPVHWQASSIPLVLLLMFSNGVMMRISLGLTAYKTKQKHAI